jgi:ribonuclease E
MATRMLIDATHPEETRVVVVKGTRLEEFDFETSTKRPLKGNIYLAKVTRVEPSLQAAFVEYGGNRHGFLAFGEIHPDYYQIPIADRQALLERQAAEDARAAAEEDEADEVAAAKEAAGEATAEAIDAEPADTLETLGGEGGFRELPALETEAAPAREFDHQADGGGYPIEQHADDGVAEPQQAVGIAAEPIPEVIALPDTAAGASMPLTVSQAVVHEVAAYEAPEEYEPRGEQATTGELADNGTNTPDADAIAEEAHGNEAREIKTNGEVTSVGGDDLDEVVTPRRVRPIRSYKIQEVIKRRQIMLVQVVKEERGNKGAALTTFLSLAGRYCVLMPNTARGGGISRKIVSATDRKRLKNIVEELDVPEGMGVILRTAGMDRSKAEIKRDFEYLLRLWDNVRELTLKSTAPCLVYEEGSLIKRAIRDYYSAEIDEILVEGEEAYRTAKDFMRMLMPSHAKRVQPYRERIHLMHRFQVEQQFDSMYSPTVQLKSGGYIVINPTEALVAIDVNSGKSTREHNIEETAYKTNMEAAEEIARQLRLRDLAGLIVIDFIDMQDNRNNRNVERRMKECLKADRARIQVGRISAFGLLEMSRQRLRPSLLESSTEICAHCQGKGYIRSTESTALHVLRAIEDEGMRDRSAEITVFVGPTVAIYLLNHKRDAIRAIEERYLMRVTIEGDEELVPPAHRIDRQKTRAPGTVLARPIHTESAVPTDAVDDEIPEPAVEAEAEEAGVPEADPQADAAGAAAEDSDRKRRRRRRRRRRGDEGGTAPGATVADDEQPDEAAARADDFAPANGMDDAEDDDDIVHPGERHLNQRLAEHRAAPQSDAATAEGEERRRRRRGRRGGKRRRREGEAPFATGQETHQAAPDAGAEHDVHHAEPAAAPYEAPVPEAIIHDHAVAEPAAWSAPRDIAPSYQPAASTATVEPEPVAPEPEHRPPPAVASEPAAIVAEAPAPVVEEAPAGPPKRGWWRRRSS